MNRVTLLPRLAVLALLLAPLPAQAQTRRATDPPGGSIARFLGGAAAALGAHEAGHLSFDILFDADPELKRVDFHGLPFFAITHRPDLSRRREAIISSAGLWVQNGTNEWLLTSRPRLRSERAPFVKGMFAFNVLASVAYSGAAFARTGPHERDTRGMAAAARIDERWIGAMVLAPAVLDAWRYFQPESKWIAWVSRGAKVGLVLLVFR